MHHQFSPRVLCGGVCGILRACRHCHYSTRTSCRVSVDQSPSSGFVRLVAIVSLRGISSCVMIASTRKGVRARTKAQGIRFSNCGFTAIYLAVSPAPVIAVGRGRSFLVSEYPLPGIICHLRLAGDVRFLQYNLHFQCHPPSWHNLPCKSSSTALRREACPAGSETELPSNAS